MHNMIEHDTQHLVIADTLVNKGVFAISDIENQIEVSRSWLSKTLRRLVERNILLMTSESGSLVRYKLANSKDAVDYIFNSRDNLSADQLAKAWGIGLASAKRNIKFFVEEGVVLKQGLPPQKIIYSLSRSDDIFDVSDDARKAIDKYYLYVTPDGQLLKGVTGFLYWAKNKSGRSDIKSLADEYLSTRRNLYNDKDKVFLIDATEKIRQVFGEENKLIRLFHRDFDSLPVFGKTYLSQMIRIAKAGRTNTAVMNYIVDSMRDSIKHIIQTYHIDAIAFIPPTVMRKTQLMTFMAKKLRLDLPIIPTSKHSGLVPVQQKSLKNIKDRVLNAEKTIVVPHATQYENVLLIDDVTGSGATLNSTAKKILNQSIAKKVYGFTVTGSAKANDFEVISEA